MDRKNLPHKTSHFRITICNTQYSTWTIAIEISEALHFMAKWHVFYGICYSLVLEFGFQFWQCGVEQWSPLQPPYYKEHSSPYLQHPHWRVLYPVLQMLWFASSRWLGGSGSCVVIGAFWCSWCAILKLLMENAFCATDLSAGLLPNGGIGCFRRLDARSSPGSNGAVGALKSSLVPHF